MPITITLDNPATSSAQFTTGPGVLMRGGTAAGLSEAGIATKETAFHAVLAALNGLGIYLTPQGGSPHPADATKSLTQILMNGFDGDQLRFQLRYENPLGIVATAAIFEVDGALQSKSQAYLPGTREPLYVSWVGRKVANGDAEPIGARIERDTTPFPYLQPIVRVSSYLITQGFIDDATAARHAGYIGTVNDAAWLGKPRACWLMTNYKSSSSQYQGYYSVRAEALAKGGANDTPEDWRGIEILRSRMTGRIAVPPQQAITDALAARYHFGKITQKETGAELPGQANQGATIYSPDGDGFLVVGPYHTINFPALWGALVS